MAEQWTPEIQREKDERRDRAARFMYDPMGWAQYYKPEVFDHEMTYQHIEAWRMLGDYTIPKAVECAWRGKGKTTVCSTLVEHGICYRQFKFVLYISKSFDAACEVTEGIKTELLTNNRIKEDFGVLRAQEYGGQDLSYSKKAWYVCDPQTGAPFAFVVPRGINQQVRGKQVRIGGRVYRPDFIVIDDLEDDTEVENEELRKRDRKWFFGSLMKCIDTKKNPDARSNRWSVNYDNPVVVPWRVRYIDTLKHEDAMMSRLLQDGDWSRLVNPVGEFYKDEIGRQRIRSLVPELISTATLSREVASAKENGVFDEFCREMMCVPIATDGDNYSRDLFQYYNEGELHLQIRRDVDRMVICDPAKTATSRSAYTAILAAAFDASKNKGYFRKLVNRRLHPEEIIEEAIKLCLETNSQVLAVDLTGLDEWGEYLFKSFLAKAGMWDIQLIDLKGRVGAAGDFGKGKEAAKIARAAMLLPFYRNKVILHEHSLKDSPLEAQALSYPRPRFWDCLDCAGYFPRALALMGRILTATDPEERPQDWGVRGYDDLGKKIRRGDWRRISMGAFQ